MEETQNKSNRLMKTLLIICCAVILGLLILVGVLLGLMSQDKEHPDKTENEAQTTTQKSDATTTLKNEEIPKTQEEVISFPQLTILTTEEQGEMVLVSTTYGNLKYPIEFSDLLVVREANDPSCARLDVFALINEREAKLFTLWFGKKQGADVGTIKIADWDDAVSVTVEFHDDTTGMNDGDLMTYYAAKETFNEIVQSLSENEGFIPTN